MKFSGISHEGVFYDIVEEWLESGELVTCFDLSDGISTEIRDGGILWQERYENGRVVERRENPPWFSEDEVRSRLGW